MSENNLLQQPLVSVIIPTYNRPEYLKQALASAVKQTYRNIEIIVSDNCSDENPQAIVDSFQDSRIRFWRNSKNLGMLPNGINAIKMACGKYVALLNDDDMWEENFLEKLVPPLEANPDLVLSFCDHYIMNADGEIDYALTEQRSQLLNRNNLREGVYQPFYEQAIVNICIPSASASAVIRRDAVDWDAIPLEVGGCYDLYINYLCSRFGRAAYCYPKRLARYRLHVQSDTMSDDAKTTIRKAQNQIFCYEQFMKDLELNEFKKIFENKWLAANYRLGISLLEIGQITEARSSFWRVIRKKKLSLRSYKALILTLMPRSRINKLLKMNQLR